MVIKLYISGISGNKEVKKKQQRVQMILDSKQINYEAIDITEPGKEKDKEFMQQNGKVRESLGKYPLPPQIFNDDDFCGDYEDFDMANEVDELEKFLHIETNSKDMENGSKIIAGLLENPPPQDEKSEGVNKEFFDKNKDSTDSLYNPYEYHTFTIKYNSVNGLKEEITNINSLVGEKEPTEEVTKSEVNGESETVPTLDPSNENITESVETSAEAALAPEEEGSAAKETTAENENESEGREDKHEVEAEMPEKEAEDEEEAGNEKEDKVESSEKPPPSEEEEEKEKEEEVAEDSGKEKNASEEEEEEGDRDSPESEKSQEE